MYYTGSSTIIKPLLRRKSTVYRRYFVILVRYIYIAKEGKHYCEFLFVTSVYVVCAVEMLAIGMSNDKLAYKVIYTTEMICYITYFLSRIK